MELTFEEVLTFDNKDRLQFGHEPDNLFIEYYLRDKRLENQSSDPYMGDFNNLDWKTEARRITAVPVSNFGIKTFPQFGAYGFFTPKYGDGTSKIISPINKKRSINEQPYLEITQIGPNVKVNIYHPRSNVYDCYRIMFRDEWFATEFITYDLEFITDSLPPAEYDVTAIGYSDKGLVSIESKLLLVELDNPVNLPTTQLNTIVFSPNSKYVAIGCMGAPSMSAGGLFIYSVNATTNILTKLTDPSGDPIPSVKSVGWSEDNTQLTATLFDDTTRNFNISTTSYSTTTTQHNLKQEESTVITESPDGRYVMYCTEEFKWFATNTAVKFTVV